jgi:putative acetyltransferase
VTQKITIRASNPGSLDARRLIEKLDAYLNNLYPAESNYLLSAEALQQPGVTFIKARLDGKTVGCGAIVNHDGNYGEIKRMFVLPDFRGRGVGMSLLVKLELIARKSGLTVTRLETGVYQTEALGLYKKAGYRNCQHFGDYDTKDPLLVFMEKKLDDKAKSTR